MFDNLHKVLTAVAAMAVSASAAPADQAKREMSVQQGPDSVFAEPVDQVFPELRGAGATGENGRVGNELVFWGYRLAGGRDAWLVACAMLRDVDCEARTKLVCPGSVEMLATTTQAGLVRRLRCDSVSFVGVGDTRPGCSDSEASLELSVSLVQCN